MVYADGQPHWEACVGRRNCSAGRQELSASPNSSDNYLQISTLRPLSPFSSIGRASDFNQRLLVESNREFPEALVPQGLQSFLGSLICRFLPVVPKNGTFSAHFASGLPTASAVVWAFRPT